MKGRLFICLLWLCFCGSIISGCAAWQNSFWDTPLQRKRTAEARLQQVLLERALQYEQQGEPVKALQTYDAALAVLQANKAELQASLRQRAEEHYLKGRALWEQGKYQQGRHELLLALRLRPDYPEVLALLQPKERFRSWRYVIHRVKEGEYLTAIAKRYYGDQTKFDIIARFNNLEDATTIHAGMKLKIPVIEGVKFLPEKTASSRTAAKRSGGKLSLQKSASSGAKERALSEAAVRQRLPMQTAALAATESEAAAGEIYDPVNSYEEHGISLFEDGRYLAALVEFQKVLNSYPERKKSRQYMGRAHYRLGLALLEKGDYLEARSHFKRALTFDQQCTLCRRYLQKCEATYKSIHYRKGIQYFEAEDLEKAIHEWQLVKQLDPHYKQVQSYLNRAATLLEKIRKLKRDS
ncbi:MAG: tetratricopeptide repeat protein [Deltaproteobacteria bacterium]|nr:tetratricopeptide repeat protein [Deltaproteobacteria bacterium]MBW2071268.1 tetratricopeptide repeat protein [Deltaproteobacteria bacterium]